ncbi:hypothetical protein QBC39DRAFT_30036 [Podospora conica]|nr:hypothetical protein QBC39DRAFT_30036 [Schizothecium conicum]
MPKPLRTLKLALRALLLLTSLLLLILQSTLLITLSQHAVASPIPVRAVAGIAGAALIYSTVCVLALRFARPETTTSPPVSLASMLLDAAFASAMIYVASVNSVGSGGCAAGREVDTPLGRGTVGKGEGVGGLGVDGGCRVAVGGLVGGVLGIFLFIFSILTELGLIRQRRRESRFAPGPIMPGTTMPGAWGGEDEKKEDGGKKAGGFWGWLTGKRKKDESGAPLAPNPDALPGHALPEDVRQSEAVEEDRLEMAQQGGWVGATRREGDGYGRGGGAGYGRGAVVVGNVDGYGNGYGHGRQAYVGGGDLGYGGDRMEEVPLARFPPANYRYGDGVYDRV